MDKNQSLLNLYNEDEIKKLLNDKVKMVYIDNGSEEFVARYEDLPSWNWKVEIIAFRSAKTQARRR